MALAYDDAEPNEPADGGSRPGSFFEHLERVEHFGVHFVALPDEAAFADEVMEWRPHGPPELVITPNVDILVQRSHGLEPELEAVFGSASVHLPDGFPIVAASRLTDRPLPARLAGSTLFAQVWPRWCATARPITVVAANPAIVERLEDEHPRATFVVPPRLDQLDSLDAVVASVLSRVQAIDAEVVVIGLGFPNDLRLAAAILEAWPEDRPGPLLISLGASAEMYLGLRPRAPEWMQRTGLEWFYRFLQEPRRMFHRYFVRDLAFFPMAWDEIRRSR